MPKQVKEDVVETEVIETPEQAKAAQLEGFQEAETSTPVAKTEKSAEEIQKEADEAVAATAAAEKVAADEVAAKAATEKDKPVLAGYTEAQIAQAVKKAEQFDTLKSSLDKVNGKFGSIEQTLKDLAANRAANIQLTKEDFTELETEFGPELAAAMLKALNKALPKLTGAGAQAASKDDKGSSASQPTAAELQKIIDDSALAIRAEGKAGIELAKQTVEMRFLTREHKDWRSIIQGDPLQNADGTPMVDAHGNPVVAVKPEFKAWIETKPQADQDRLMNTWDAELLSDTITEYKKHVADTKAAAAKQIAAKKQTPARVATAVSPHGIPGTPAIGKTAKEEQMEGYNAA